MTPSPASKFKSAAIALQRIFEKDKLANKHRKEIAKFFISQRDLTLQYLKKLEPLFEEKSPLVKTQAAIPGWDAVWNEIAKRSTEELKRIIIDAEIDGLKAGSTRGSTELSMTGPLPKTTFNLANPRAVAFMKENGGSLQYIRGIQDTTKSELQTIITDALDTGKSYGQLEKEIKTRFSEYSEKLPGKDITRAHLIAITETGKAYEEGNAEFARGLADAGITMVKTWETSKDDRVSDGCQENEDEGPIPINQYHTSGHMQPPRFPSCRCYESYEQAGSD